MFGEEPPFSFLQCARASSSLCGLHRTEYVLSTDVFYQPPFAGPLALALPRPALNIIDDRVPSAGLVLFCLLDERSPPPPHFSSFFFVWTDGCGFAVLHHAVPVRPARGSGHLPVPHDRPGCARCEKNMIKSHGGRLVREREPERDYRETERKTKIKT